jgi:hypothetical protein
VAEMPPQAVKCFSGMDWMPTQHRTFEYITVRNMYSKILLEEYSLMRYINVSSASSLSNIQI